MCGMKWHDSFILYVSVIICLIHLSKENLALELMRQSRLRLFPWFSVQYTMQQMSWSLIFSSRHKRNRPKIFGFGVLLEQGLLSSAQGAQWFFPEILSQQDQLIESSFMDKALLRSFSAGFIGASSNDTLGTLKCWDQIRVRHNGYIISKTYCFYLNFKNII